MKIACDGSGATVQWDITTPVPNLMLTCGCGQVFDCSSNLVGPFSTNKWNDGDPVTIWWQRAYIPYHEIDYPHRWLFVDEAVNVYGVDYPTGEPVNLIREYVDELEGRRVRIIVIEEEDRYGT